MTDRPASWRMPTPKQMDEMAALVGRNVPPKPGLAPDADLPAEYWQALLADPRAEAAGFRSRRASVPARQAAMSTSRPIICVK